MRTEICRAHAFAFVANVVFIILHFRLDWFLQCLGAFDVHAQYSQVKIRFEKACEEHMAEVKPKIENQRYAYIRHRYRRVCRVSCVHPIKQLNQKKRGRERERVDGGRRGCGRGHI